MKKKFRSLLSLVLAAAMVVGLLPAAALPARAAGEADPLGLDGQTLAIINPANSVAMLSETKTDSQGTALESLALGSVALSNGTCSVSCTAVGDAARICVWEFSYTGSGTTYYISTKTGTGTKYLKMALMDVQVGRFSLVDSPAEASPFKVESLGDGRCRLSASLSYHGGAAKDVHISYDTDERIFGGFAGEGKALTQGWLVEAVCTRANITEPAPPIVGVSPVGTTIDLFDYWVDMNNPLNDQYTSLQAKDSNEQLYYTNYGTSGINAASPLKFTSSGVGTQAADGSINVYTGVKGAIRSGIVQNQLGEDGFPVLAGGLPTGYSADNPLGVPATTTGGESLAYLFNHYDADSEENKVTGKTSYMGVNGLLQVDNDGYFYFDSAKTAAQMDTDKNSPTFKKFSLYNTEKSIGFFPFNHVAQVGTGYVNDSGTPITGYDSNDLNHFFGVHMSTQFIQSKAGMRDAAKPITYEFTGDDDVWIFIDGVLVGDVGGIHEADKVKIDFSSGDVTYICAKANGSTVDPAEKDPSTILQQYINAAGEGNVKYYKTVANADGSARKTESTVDDANLAEVTIDTAVYTFQKAAGGGWIFADNTYHTLDFFYLERGGYASNMHLKYNLEEIPPTYIQKVDQDGQGIPGVHFDLHVVVPQKDGAAVPTAELSNYTWTSGEDTVPVSAEAIADGDTDENGLLTLRYTDYMPARHGKLLSLEDLYVKYGQYAVGTVVTSGDGEFKNAILLELTESPSSSTEGYRTLSTISLRLEKINGTYILRSNDRWNNGTYAAPNVVVSTSHNITLRREMPNGSKTVDLNDRAYENEVGLFAVVLAWIGSDPPNETTILEDKYWAPVVGSAAEGWTIMDLHLQEGENFAQKLGQAIGQYSRGETGRETRDPNGTFVFPFKLSDDANYSAEINHLPGEIDSYFFMVADEDGTVVDKDGDGNLANEYAQIKFTTSFYFSTADTYEAMDGNQTYRVDHRASGFQRDFGATVNVPNIQNRLVVQRLDAVGNTVEGAEFTLYGPVEPKAGGTSADTVQYDPKANTLTVGGTPVTALSCEKTQNLVKDKPDEYGHTAHLTIAGAAAFHGLPDGIYYLVETKAPAGYTRNEEIVKVIVDENGVHAYAGDAGTVDKDDVNDGIDTNRGIPYGDGDGISVLLGPGSLVQTMSHFGSTGDVDNTLTDIYALRARAKTADGRADAGRDVDELTNWYEVETQNADKLQRKWRIYDPDSPLEYKYATGDAEGKDILGHTNQMSDVENPYGYISASGWNWDLLTQNYYGIFDMGVSYNDISTMINLTQDQIAAINNEISNKTRLPHKTENLDTDVSTGFTSYGNKILTGLFSGTTVVRVASDEIASLSISKEVKKDKESDTLPEDARFPFTLSFTYTAPVFEEVEGGRTEQQVGDIDFTPRALAGEYTYTVRDNNGNITETGTLDIDESGTLVGVTPTPPAAGAAGENTRFADGKLYLKANETLTIHDLPVGTTYTVTEDAVSQYTAAVVGTVTNGADGDAVETTEGVRTATNKLEKPGQADTVTYTNTYHPGSAVISGKKVLEGYDLDEKMFTFTLTQVNGTEVAIGDPLTAQNAADGSFSIPLNDLRDGTYTYLLQETEPADKVYPYTKITYDKSVYRVKVTVAGQGNVTVAYEKKGDDGTFTAVEEEDILFTNTYAPDNGTLTGAEALKVKKTWEADPRVRLRDGYTAAFTLTAGADNPTDGAVLPGDTTISTDGFTDGIGSFGDITFKKAGEYTFTISEEQGTASGVTYDATVYTVTVTVEDTDGALKVRNTAYKKTADGTEVPFPYSDTNPMAFTNKYATDKAVINGTKVLTGRDWANADRFEFTLTKEGESDPLGTAAATKDQQSFSFEVSDLAVGEHTYYLKETKGADADITYDTSVYKVEVDVPAEDVAPTITYTKGTMEGNVFTPDPDQGTPAPAAAAFTNTYTAPTAEVKVEYYLNEVTPGTKVNDPTNFQNPFAVNIGTTWKVGVGTAGNGYNAPKTLRDNGVTYAYDPNATTVVKTADGTQIADASFTADTISREMGKENVTVRLVYAPDGNGDQIPDKYQVTVRYESEDIGKGTVSNSEEILTITGTDGKYAETGNVTAIGSAATAGEGYKFVNWTGSKASDGSTENLTNVPTDSTTGQITLIDVKGGDVYTYTAHFEEIRRDLSVVKRLVKVGTVDITSGMTDIPKAKVNDTITWTITVTNTGNVEQPGVVLTGLTLYDVLTDGTTGVEIPGIKVYKGDVAAGQEYLLGTETFDLAEHASQVFTAVYTVKAEDAGKQLLNTAIVSGPGGEVPGTTPDPVPVEKPGLSITKTPEHQSAKAGDTVTWTVTVSNTGNVELTNVLVTDALTIGTETGFVAADGWEKVEAEGVMQTPIASLAPGASQTFTATYAVPEETPANTVITNVATAKCGDLSATAQADVTTTGSDEPGPGPVNPTPGIAVTKTLTAVNGAPYYGGTVREGDMLTYTIVVTNTGDVELTAVSLADRLPGGLYPSGAQDWELGPMGIGDRREVSFTAVVASGTSGWSLANTATATGTAAEGDPVTASDVETVQVEVPYVPPIPPVPPIDPEPDQPVTPPEDLNTKDHVAYIIGYPDGTVRPDGNITRAEVATIFFRLLTDEARETYWCQTNGYTDVPAQRWYNNAVSTLSNMGIISGYPDGSFRPDAPITRAELTKIAVGFFQYADQHFRYQGDFSDVTGREWYAGFVAAASALGLIEGYPDGTFRPNEAITRAETCTIVNRTLGRKPHEDHLLPYEVMITWPDNRLDAWYYAQIQEATNSHDYLWISITENWETMEAEEWTAKLEERDWAALEHMWSTAHSAPGGEVMD